MKTNLLIPTIAGIVSLTACGTLATPVSTAPPQNNVTYKVDYLFEHEGCKVYRFYDRGNNVYFTNCKGETIAMTDSTSVRNRINTTSKDAQSGVGQQEVTKQEHAQKGQ